MSFEWVHAVRLRARALLHRRRLERDLEDELQFHLAERAGRARSAGLPVATADLEARRHFGNPTYFKETCRDMWTIRWIEMLSQDLRFAARTLRKSPGFTLVAALTLALGIGANTAIFSVVDAVILRPLPYPDPHRLVELWGNVKRAKVERRGASYPDYADWRSQSQSFASMAAFDNGNFTLTGVEEPERIQGEFAGAAYFSLLGVSPVLGRTFRAEEDLVAQRDAVVILSDGLWKRRFGGDPGILGRSMRLGDREYSAIGVMPPWFRGVTDQAELWVPFVMSNSAQGLAQRGSRGFAALARLKPGVSLAQAQSEMDGISRRLEKAYLDTNEGRAVELSPLETEIFGDLRKPLLVLLGAVGFVLMIACTNVANLLLARSEARQREIAMRIALGAGRGRELHQLTTESFLLVFAGAAAGLMLAQWGVKALMAASPVTFPSYIHPALDPRVAAFMIVISAVAALVLGIAPAIHVRSGNLYDSFKQASSHAADSRSGSRFRGVLVVAEVAVAMLLLVGAGLLIRSLQELAAIRPGYDPAHVLTLRVVLPRIAPPTAAAGSSPAASAVRSSSPATGSAAASATRSSPVARSSSSASPAVGSSPAATPPPAADARTVIAASEVVRRMAQIPSVESAAAASDIPLGGSNAIFYAAEGQPPVNAQNRPRAYIHRASPEFFRTLHIRFTAGRPFTEQELASNAQVAIVTENLVKRFWAGQDPIGKRIKGGPADSQDPWISIVGVVNEMKYRGLPNNPTADPDIFLPFTDRARTFSLLMRTPLDPASLAPSVRKVLRDADPTTIVFGVSTLTELASRETAQSRFTGWLMGIFAGTALLLAMIGIYGVMSYTVSRRTQEIGIRMALGASRSDVLGLVVSRGMWLIAAGLAAGIAAARALTTLMGSMLYGVTATDLVTFAAAAAALAAVAFVACVVPAARAMRIHPAIALRNE